MSSLSMLSRFAALSVGGTSARIAGGSAVARALSSRLGLSASTTAISSGTDASWHGRSAATAAAKTKTAKTASTGARATRAKKATATKAKTKKAAPKKKAVRAKKPKKAAAKPKPKKKKVAVKKAEPKPWIKYDANGKLVPLPQDTKPKARPAYILYLQEQLAKPGIKAEAKKVGFTSYFRDIAKQWNALSQSEKQTYLNAAAEEKAKYEVELEKWKSSLTPEDIKRQNDYERYHQRRRQAALKATEAGTSATKNTPRARRSLALRDPLKPKRPVPAFFHFLGDYRAKHYDETLRQNDGNAPQTLQKLAIQGAEEWKRSSSEVKHPYEERSKRELEEYHVALKAYELRASH